jgi:GNAT superfamily N-acetyltransferase
MHCTIGAAQESDIPRLVELLRELFGHEADFAADPARQRRGLALLLAAAAQGERVNVAVARDERGVAIAMASAQLVISTAEGALSAWIEDVVVDAGWRRRAVGQRLIHYLLAWARERGATRAQLVTDIQNADALRFYDRIGWTGTQLTVRRRSIE